MMTSERDGFNFLLSGDIEPIFWTPERQDCSSGWWGHVPFAFWITTNCKPRLFVELGTHHGVSYAAFCEATIRSQLNTRCYAVDTWKGDAQAGLYDEDVYRALKAFHDKRYGSFSELLRATFDDACSFFEDGTVDLLHIDGYHTYEAVRHDFETWRPKLSKQAVVLFHDTNVRRDDFGVWRFFAELRTQLPSFEFLHSYGLGIVAAGVEPPATIKRLCELNDDQVLLLRQRFAYFGTRWTAATEKASADRELMSLRKHLAWAQSLDKELHEKVAWAKSLDKELNDLRAAHARILADYEALEVRAKSLKAEIDGIKSSASWRIARRLKSIVRPSGFA
jgi:O-antigen biosynthesis protein